MRYRYPICALTALTMLAATACAQQPPARDPAPSPVAKAVKPAGLTLDTLLANMEAARRKLMISRNTRRSTYRLPAGIMPESLGGLAFPGYRDGYPVVI